MLKTQGGVNKWESRNRDKGWSEGNWLTKMWSDIRPDVYANRFDIPRVSLAGAEHMGVWVMGRRADRLGMWRAPLSPTAQQMSTFNPSTAFPRATWIETGQWGLNPTGSFMKKTPTTGKGSTYSWRHSRSFTIAKRRAANSSTIW